MVSHILNSLLHLVNGSHASIDTTVAALKALSAYYGKVGGQDTEVIEQLVTSAHHPNTIIAIAALDSLYTIALTMNNEQRRTIYQQMPAYPWEDYLHYRRTLSRTRRMNQRALARWQSAVKAARGVSS